MDTFTNQFPTLAKLCLLVIAQMYCRSIYEKNVSIEKTGAFRLYVLSSHIWSQWSYQMIFVYGNESHFFNFVTRMRISPIQSCTSRRDESFFILILGLPDKIEKNSPSISGIDTNSRFNIFILRLRDEKGIFLIRSQFSRLEREF